MDATSDNNSKKRKSEAMEGQLAADLQTLLLSPLKGGEPLNLSLLATVNIADIAKLKCE